MRLAPACGQRLSDFQPDFRSLNLLCGLNVARVLSPRWNRRTGDRM